MRVTWPTPHDLDDFDPQCHLIRTPTPEKLSPPHRGPVIPDSITTLSRHGIGWFGGPCWLWASRLGNGWLAPRKLVDPSRYGYLVLVHPLIPEPISSSRVNGRGSPLPVLLPNVGKGEMARSYFLRLLQVFPQQTIDHQSVTP